MVSIWASHQNSLQLTVYSLQNQVENRQRQLKHLEDQRGDLALRLASVEQEARGYQDQDRQLMEKLEKTKVALTEILQGLESVAVSLDGQMAARNLLREEIEGANREGATIRAELDQINASLHESEVKKARWQSEDEALVRELGGRFGIGPEQGLSHLDGRYTANELSAVLRKLQGRIQEMGEINLASIQQHKKLQERLEFLIAQKYDLVKAEQDIMGLVSELDKTIRELFMETFTNVQQHFTDIFKVLFDGGSAYLSLSDEDDLLETGIEIFARPPGKKTQSLSLLSGGEKSMTAIALLFALQSVRPSPFCILDEIEAALDDVNILRFANYLRQLSEGTQFILITHRRETMENSDSLYGITLAADGSSKPISVTFKKDEQRVSGI
jgi:chromosome segregation protein